MPARIVTFLSALALAAGLSACGSDDKGGPGHAASLNGGFREGLAEPLADDAAYVTGQSLGVSGGLAML